MAENETKVIFGASVEGLIAGVKQARQAVESFVEPINDLKAAFAGIGEALIAAFAVEKAAEFVKQMAELGEHLEHVSTMLGIDVDTLGKLNFAAAASGTTTESMNTALERLSVNLQRAQTGTGPAADALRAMGLGAKELTALPLSDALGKIADKFATWKDGANKTALAMELLGRGGAELIPLLDKGAAGIAALGQQADDTSSVISHKVVESLAETDRSLKVLDASYTSLKATIVATFGTPINDAIRSLTEFIGRINDLILSGTVFDALIAKVANFGRQLAIELTAIGKITYDALTGQFEKIEPDLKATQDAVLESWRKYGRDLLAIQFQIAATKKALEGGSDKPNAPSSANTANAAAKEIDAEIKVLQQGLEQKKILLNAEASQGLLTQNEKFKALEDETSKEYTAEAELLQRKLALYGRDTKEYAAVLGEIKVAHAKNVTDMLKLDEESIAAQQKLFTNLGTAITSSFNGSLKGLIEGTTSFKQAFTSTIESLLIKFIEFVEELGVKWIASEVARTTASQTGAAARLAAEQTAVTASLPERAAKFVSDITADAAVVFAGVFANLAPLLGPAAAGPAAASQGTILAQLGNIPKFDVGTNYVASSGLAVVHRGEEIKPAQGTGPYTGAGDAGGISTGDLHMHNYGGKMSARDFADAFHAAWRDGHIDRRRLR